MVSGKSRDRQDVAGEGEGTSQGEEVATFEVEVVGPGEQHQSGE